MAGDVTFSSLRPYLLSTAVCQAPIQASGDSAAHQATALPLAASSLFLYGPAATVIHVLQKHNVGFGWRRSLSPTQSW